MNPGAPVFELEELIGRLWEETEAIAELAEKAGRAEVKHKTRYSQELLLAEGTVPVKEATAQVKVEQEFLERRIAEAKHAAQQELLRTLRTTVDALRTLNANARSAT